MAKKSCERWASCGGTKPGIPAGSAPSIGSFFGLPPGDADAIPGNSQGEQTSGMVIAGVLASAGVLLFALFFAKCCDI